MQVTLRTAVGYCDVCPYMYQSAGIQCCNIYNDICQACKGKCLDDGGSLYGEHIASWRDDCKGCRWCDKSRGYCRLHAEELLKYPSGKILKAQRCLDGMKQDYGRVQLFLAMIGGIILWLWN